MELLVPFDEMAIPLLLLSVTELVPLVVPLPEDVPSSLLLLEAVEDVCPFCVCDVLLDVFE